jgi:hypothetical protein
MDPNTAALITTVVIAEALAVASVHLRLRARARLERTRQHGLADLVRGLPQGSALQDVRNDGSRLHLVLARPVDVGKGAVDD